MMEDPTDLDAGEVMDWLEKKRDHYGADAVSITVSDTGCLYEIDSPDEWSSISEDMRSGRESSEVCETAEDIL